MMQMESLGGLVSIQLNGGEVRNGMMWCDALEEYEEIFFGWGSWASV